MNAPAVSTRVVLPAAPACAAALRVVQRLRAAGHEALLVGGCVRDLLLGATPKDYDVATSAEPQQVLALFDHVLEVGMAFGVVRVRLQQAGHWFETEVATFRADGPYADGRRPLDVRFTDAREDVLRRDFTINGLLLAPDAEPSLDAEVLDFVGGLADLRAGVVRAIGQPRERFGEDALRLLRAPRFAARLGFAVEPQTAAAIGALAADLRKVSVERITQEISALVHDRHAARGLALLAELGLGAALWPQLAAADVGFARSQALLAALHAQPQPHQQVSLSLAAAALALAYDPDNPALWLTAAEHERTLRLSNHERQTLRQLLQLFQDALRLGDALWPQPGAQADALRWLRQPAAHGALRLLAATAVAGWPHGKASSAVLDWLGLDALRRRLPHEQLHPVPWVSGDTLRSWGHAPGPAFRAALEAAERAQLDGAPREAAEAAARAALAAADRPIPS